VALGAIGTQGTMAQVAANAVMAGCHHT